VLLGSVRDAHLLAVATSPDLVLAAFAVFDPPIHTGEAFELLVCHGAILSQFCHHLIHLVCIDGGVIPCHTVASLAEVASELAVHHAADELLPRGLVIRAELHTRLSGVVEEFIVANPEGGIPGLVVCPTVVGADGGSGHDLGSFGMCKFYRVSASVAVADVPDIRLTHVVACCRCLADSMAALLLTGELLHVGCHSPLNSGVVGSGVVEKEHSVVLFDHALSIGDLVGSGENGGRLSLWHTEHQISDGIGDTVSTTPADGVTRGRAHPDHAFLSPHLGDPKGVVHVGSPVATVGVKLAPC